MKLIESLFKGQINKAVNSQLALQFGSQYAQSLQNMMAFMNGGLPTINPDGFDYYQSFKTIGAVYETTDLISKKVIGSPYVFYKVKDAKKLQKAKSLFKSDPVQSYIMKMQAIEEVDNTALTHLLNNPNPYQTGTQWEWTSILAYLIHGNNYIHGTFDNLESSKRRALELFCFPNMRIIGDNLNLLDPILGYELMNTESTKFLKDEIYHMKTGNPAPVDMTLEYLYGVSPLRAYLEPMRTIEEAKKQSSKQAKNGGAFGVLSPKNKEDQLNPDQKKQLLDKIKEARGSNEEMKRVFVSSISLAWEQIGLPIGDLMLLETIGASEEDVYRAFHVPLQYHNQKASTSNNEAASIRKLIYDGVAPICDMWGESLTRFIGPGFDNVTIEKDYTQLPEMAVNMKEVADYLNALPKGVLTPNEMRIILKWGEKKEAYMNEHYVESSLTTMKRVFDGTNNNPTNT